jgi:hypothetical protein
MGERGRRIVRGTGVNEAESGAGTVETPEMSKNEGAAAS